MRENGDLVRSEKGAKIIRFGAPKTSKNCVENAFCKKHPIFGFGRGPEAQKGVIFVKSVFYAIL
jgi:hypothetical protein